MSGTKFDSAAHKARLTRQRDDIHRIDRMKAAIVASVGQGVSVTTTLQTLKVSTKTYENWRAKDPDFRARVTAARANQADGVSEAEALGLYDGTFASFRKIFLGMETFPHQQHLVDVLNGVKPREIVLVNLHPEAGKTTTIVDWCTKTLAEDPNHRITYISRSVGLGRKVVGQLERRLSEAREYPSLIGRFGPFYVEKMDREGKPWTQNYFTVWKARHDERDYSFEVRGWNSAAYGSRIDTLIVDDVQSQETLAQTQKIVDSLRHTYFTRGRRMRIVFVGTRVGPGDVYDTLLNQDIITHHIDLPATDWEGTPKVPEWWVDEDERYTLPRDEMVEIARERLTLIRKQVGEVAWWSEYMQRPNADMLATFTEDTIEGFKDRDRVAGQPSQPHLPTAAGLDPALGGVNAITVGAMGAEKLEVLDILADSNLARTEDILNRVQDVALAYRISMLIIENNAFQRAFARDERLREMGKKYGFQIVEHATHKNKADPMFGVASMAGAMQRNEISVPWGDNRTEEIIGPLIGEMMNWRPDLPTKVLLQDRIMSLWFLWRHWAQQVAMRDQAKQQTWGRRGVLWTPMSMAKPLQVRR